MNTYTDYEREAINVSLAAMRRRMLESDVMSDPDTVKQYLQLRLATEPDEWFTCLFLSTQQQLIAYERLFIAL